VPLIVIAGIAWFALRSRAEAPPAAPKGPTSVTATLVQVTQADVPHYLTGVGSAQALATVTVKTRVDGQLDRIAYTEGQDVKQGQLLAQLDARPLQAQLEQVQAQKARDEAQLANAQTDLARYQRLIKDDAVTQQALDTQRTLVTQLQAALKTDDAQIHYAQVQLGYTTITAPLSGRVGAKLVDPGNIVHAADANGLVVINQIDPIAVTFTLPGDVLPEVNKTLRANPKLAVQAWSRDGKQLLGTGTLVLVNNQIDLASGTVQMKARFPNPDHVLWPGQYVNARLMLGARDQVLTVPAGVVQRGQNGTFAFVVGPDQKATVRPIEVVQIQDGTAIIGKGLQAGETVVADGQYKVKPGGKVVAVATSASAAGATP
jgi:multidrug efflux system membrane fusion protein